MKTKNFKDRSFFKRHYYFYILVVHYGIGKEDALRIKKIKLLRKAVFNNDILNHSNYIDCPEKEKYEY